MVRPIIRCCLLTLCIGLVYMLTACTTTAPNPSTTTSPTLTWKVINKSDNSTQTYVGNTTVTTTQGTDYTITLIADDAGGVHQITLGSSSQWECRSGDVAQNHGPSLDKTDTQNLNPDSNGKVLTSIFLIRSVSMGPFDCQQGYALTGGSESLFGTSTNFANLSTKAVLSFKV